jgi:SAM-dependent methyltransferase
MKSFDERNRQAWSNEIRKNVMLYPNERVVAFLARNFGNLEENRSRTALDIGFGSGRHLKLLLDYGFRTYGIDYSQACLDTASRVLGDYANLMSLKTDDIRTVAFDTLFDVVINFGVAFNRPVDEMLVDLRKVHALMKPGGKMFINFRTNEDSLVGMGERIDEHSWILGPESGPYNGILYTFLSDEEAQSLLGEAGFVVEDAERNDYWKNQLKERHTWWLYTVRKG